MGPLMETKEHSLLDKQAKKIDEIIADLLEKQKELGDCNNTKVNGDCDQMMQLVKTFSVSLHTSPKNLDTARSQMVFV